MNLDLHKFLHNRTPQVADAAIWEWDGHKMPLRISGYLLADECPEPFITSIRVVLLKDDTVMTIEDFKGEFHIMPGGRREEGESLEETGRRELLEETGWGAGPLHPIGFLHFQHLAAKPKGFPFVHPDFLQRIYVAQADQKLAEAQQDTYEKEARFRPIEEAETLLKSGIQRHLLAAALAAGAAASQ